MFDFFLEVRRWLWPKSVTPPTPGDGLKTPWHSDTVSMNKWRSTTVSFLGSIDAAGQKFQFSNSTFHVS